ncbi:hypothetical protein ACH5RR_020197 [Cinchona calisaya]|uniref:Isopenicillin N synthase-like Fe(2+) 2OG dioxygenase domain-containing protein n=1 Tax=Cinchona calisaya TaxID=153742 RepID=A0ABD2ZIR5_9GENT
MEEAAQVWELFQLDYSDLMFLSSTKDASSSSFQQIQRLQSITQSVMENLGPAGPGLIAIKSVPGASILRRRLLPLARKLALLSNDDRKRIIKEHNIGSDVPLKNLDRIVSSFAAQLKYNKTDFDSSLVMNDDTCKSKHELDTEFKNLGYAFRELGFLMMEIGLCLARICDRVIGSQELELSLLESCSAKGRLIHYHSNVDNRIIKQAAERKGPDNGKFQTNGRTKASLQSGDAKVLFDKEIDLWQQWHYDYGIFTLLTDPMFMLSCDQECPSPRGHTYLKIFHPERDSSFMVKAPPESFIVQVGESADVLSKGLLRATLHCVCKPVELEDLSRETFVVFLQPAWSKTFSLFDYPVESLKSGSQCSDLSSEENHIAMPKSKDLFQDIHSIVPPLSLRMRDGMTFAEFSRETTKQYYGGSGLQSKR